MKIEELKTLELTFDELYKAVEQWVQSQGQTVEIAQVKEVSWLNNEVIFVRK